MCVFEFIWMEGGMKFMKHLKKGASQGRGVHVTGVSAAYTFKLNKNIISE
jgi:hypothetical protein